MSAITSYRQLEVWQMNTDLVERCYALAASLPTAEQFNLGNQIRRAAVSIPANIAEGHRRTRKAYLCTPNPEPRPPNPVCWPAPMLSSGSSWRPRVGPAGPCCPRRSTGRCAGHAGARFVPSRPRSARAAATHFRHGGWQAAARHDVRSAGARRGLLIEAAPSASTTERCGRSFTH